MSHNKKLCHSIGEKQMVAKFTKNQKIHVFMNTLNNKISLQVIFSARPWEYQLGPDVLLRPCVATKSYNCSILPELLFVREFVI